MSKKEFSQNKYKEDIYYKNNKGEKIYVPITNEIAPQFIQRLVSEATRLSHSDENNSRENYVIGEVNNATCGIIQFKISSEDDLYSALDKYYDVMKNERRKLFGGE